MFLRRRNQIIVGVVLLVFVMVAVVVSALKKDSAGPYKIVCDNLIDAIARYDYEGGHALLSASNKKIDDVYSWREKTSLLGNVYKDAQIVLVEQKSVSADTSTDSAAQTAILTYTVTHPAMTSRAVCTASQENGAYVISDFGSYPVDTSNNQTSAEEASP